MIRAEYRKVYHLLYEEERRYLERMEKESNEILQQLRASEDSMDQKGKVLRGMYEDLKKTCHEPDVELLQVRTEESHGAAWRTSTISSSTVTRHALAVMLCDAVGAVLPVSVMQKSKGYSCHT